MLRFPRIHAYYSDWQLYSIRRIDMHLEHPFMVLPELWYSQKSASYHWKYVYVVPTKFYTCYLLKVWALLVRKLLLTIVNPSFSTIDITKHLPKYCSAICYRRYSYLYFLIHKFACFLFSGARVVAQIGLKAENVENCQIFVFQLSEDSLDNLNER